jgi:hypothetical protein
LEHKQLIKPIPGEPGPDIISDVSYPVCTNNPSLNCTQLDFSHIPVSFDKKPIFKDIDEKIIRSLSSENGKQKLLPPLILHMNLANICMSRELFCYLVQVFGKDLISFDFSGPYCPIQRSLGTAYYRQKKALYFKEEFETAYLVYTNPQYRAQPERKAAKESFEEKYCQVQDYRKDIPAWHLVFLTQYCSNINRLVLKNCSVNDDLLPVISQLRELTQLDLSGCYKITQYDFLKKLQKLEKLKVSGFGEQKFNSLLATLQELPALTSLEIDNVSIPYNPALYDSEKLDFLKFIKQLNNLSKTKITLDIGTFNIKFADAATELLEEITKVRKKHVESSMSDKNNKEQIEAQIERAFRGITRVFENSKFSNTNALYKELNDELTADLTQIKNLQGLSLANISEVQCALLPFFKNLESITLKESFIDEVVIEALSQCTRLQEIQFINCYANNNPSSFCPQKLTDPKNPILSKVQRCKINCLMDQQAKMYNDVLQMLSSSESLQASSFIGLKQHDVKNTSQFKTRAARLYKMALFEQERYELFVHILEEKSQPIRQLEYDSVASKELIDRKKLEIEEASHATANRLEMEKKEIAVTLAQEEARARQVIELQKKLDCIAMQESQARKGIALSAYRMSKAINGLREKKQLEIKNNP